MVSEEGFFKFRAVVDEKYTPDSMLNDLGLDKNRKICDGYGHAFNCTWFIQECKTKNIKKAIDQLKSSAEQLIEMDRPLNKIFLILEKIGKSESRMFEVNKKDRKLYKKGSKNPVLVIGKEIQVVYKRELSEANARWHFI